MRITKISATNNNQATKRQQKNTSSQSFSGYKLEGSFIDPTFATAKNYLYKFSNGLKAMIMEKPGKDFTYLSARVNTGAMNETEAQRGISHLTEHTVFLAQKEQPTGFYDKTCARFGAIEDAATGYECTIYPTGVTNVKPSELQELITAQSRLVTSPTFPSELLDKEKAIVIEEIKKYENLPNFILDESSIKHLFGVQTSSPYLELGSVENIKNITRQDLINYHKASYTPENTEIFAVSRLPHEQIAQIIDKSYVMSDFVSAPPLNYFTPINPIKKTQINFIPNKLVDIDSIAMAFLGPKNSEEKDMVATEALLEVLGGTPFSRLHMKLKRFDSEPEVSLNAISNNPSQEQLMSINMKSKHSSLQKVIDAFRKTVDELSTSPIKAEELEMAKKNMLLNFYKKSQDPMAFEELFLRLTPSRNITGYQNYLNTVRNLTLEDVNAAQKYLTMDRVSVNIMHPEKANTKNISFLGTNSQSVGKIKKYILPNNIKVVFNDDKNKILSSIITNIEESSLAKAKPAVTDILARILENSTAKMTAEDLAYYKALNGLSEFEMSPENIGLAAKSYSLNDDLHASAKLIKEMLFEPKINKENFEKAKSEIELELQDELLSPADRAVETMYKGHPNGISNLVLKNNINKVTLQDVQQYYEALVNNGSVNVFVSGPISQTKGLDKKILNEFETINKTFSTKSQKEPPVHAPKTTQVVVQHAKGVTSSRIIQLFHLNFNSTKDIAAMSILDSILGSGGMTARLFADLRETQKLAYSVSSKFEMNGRVGKEAQKIETGIKNSDEKINDNIQKSLEGFSKHIKMLIDEPPTVEEVENAKRAILTENIMDADDVMDANEELAVSLQSHLGAHHKDKLIEELKKVTPEDVQKAAQKHLTKPSVISILTSPQAAKKSEKYLATLGELKTFKTTKN